MSTPTDVSVSGFQETLNGLMVFAGDDEQVMDILDKAFNELAKLREARMELSRDGSTYGVDDY